MKKRLTILSDSGFSIIELLVVVGIMGIVAVGFATMIANQQKEITRAAARMESFSAADEIRSVLADQANCVATFDGKGDGNDSVTALKMGASDVFQVGHDLGASRLTVDKYRLSNSATGLSPQEYELQVKFTSGSDESMTYLRLVKLRVTDHNLPISAANPCIAVGVAGNSLLTAKQICESIGATYDESVTPAKCRLPSAFEYSASSQVCNSSTKGKVVLSEGGQTSNMMLCDGTSWRKLATEPICDYNGTTRDPSQVFAPSDGWTENNGNGVAYQACSNGHDVNKDTVLRLKHYDQLSSYIGSVNTQLGHTQNNLSTFQASLFSTYSFPGCTTPSGRQIPGASWGYFTKCQVSQNVSHNATATDGSTRYFNLTYHCNAPNISHVTVSNCRDNP